jgi:hypothetical protein
MKRMKSRKPYSIELAIVAVVTASLIVACGRNVNNGGFKPRKNGTSTLGIDPGKPGPGSFVKLAPEQKTVRLRQIIAKVLMGKSDAEISDLEGLNRLLPESAVDIILGVSAELGLSGSSVDVQRDGAVSSVESAAGESLMRSNVSAVIGPVSEAKTAIGSGEFQPTKNYMKVESDGVEFRAACYEGCENLIVLISKDNAQAGFLFKIDKQTGAGQLVSSTLGSGFRPFEEAKKLVADKMGVARTIINPPIPPTAESPVIPPVVDRLGGDSADSPQSHTSDVRTGEMDPASAEDITGAPPPPSPVADKAEAPPEDKKAETSPSSGDQDKTDEAPPATQAADPVALSPGSSPESGETKPAVSPSPADQGQKKGSNRKKYGVIYSSPVPTTPRPEGTTATEPARPSADRNPRDFADGSEQVKPEDQPKPEQNPQAKPSFIVSETWDKMKALTRQGIQAILASIPKSQMGGDFDQSLVLYTSLTGSDPSKLSSENKKDLLELFQKHYHDTFALRIPYFQISLDRTSKPAKLGVDLAISGYNLDLKKRSDEGMNVALEDEILKGKTMTMDIKDVNGSSDDVRISMRCISNCKEVVAEIWFGENSENNSFTLRSAGLYKFAESGGNNGPMKLAYSTSGSSWTSHRFDSLIKLETMSNDCTAIFGKVKDCPAATEPAGSKVLDSAKLCEIDNAQLLKQKESCSKGFKDSVSAGFLEIYKGLAKNRGTEPAQKLVPPSPSVSAADSKPEVAPRQTSPPPAATAVQTTKRQSLMRSQPNRSGKLKAGQGRRVRPRIAK